MSGGFIPDDPLAPRPEPEYFEMVDPDPPPPIPSQPSTYISLMTGARGPMVGVHSPGTRRWRRWVGYAIAAVFIVPVVLYAVVTLVNVLR